MKYILGGYEIQIDEDELWRLEKYKWSIVKRMSGKLYFRRFKYSKISFKKYLNESILLHREIINCPREMMVDHINGDTFDNRKCNLRVCTNAQNQQNRFILKSNKTGLKGISHIKKYNKWRTRITVNKKTIHIGYFNNPEDAHKAYCEAAIKYHGDFANFG